MKRDIDYLPSIQVGDEVYDLTAIHIAIDFGGRQFECEFQHGPNSDGKYAHFKKTYYPLHQRWDGDDWPTDNELTRHLHNFMAAFDTTGKLSKVEG